MQLTLVERDFLSVAENSLQYPEDENYIRNNVRRYDKAGCIGSNKGPDDDRKTCPKLRGGTSRLPAS